MKICIVEWKDSRSFGGWRFRGDIINETPCSVVSIGVLIASRPAEIVLAAHSADKDVDGVMIIPRICVKRIRQLHIKGRGIE